ncbi:MAG: prepilin-type N-terminal cleavage/methylation domain-containing protein [Steroidobacteraceae bacterium]|jgi:MSHA pilin protein MshA
MQRRHGGGFTLIELVVVVTILTVLAAFALPRFSLLDSQARSSAVTSLAGSLYGASALAFAQYDSLGTAPTQVTLDGVTVTLVNGYPDVNGIVSAVQDASGFSTTASATTVTFSTNSAPTPANCSVAYTVSPAIGTAPTIAAPITSGC